MKYSIPTFFLALALFASPLTALAQTPPQATVLFDTTTASTLTARVYTVEQSLRGLLSQLNDVYSRVQIASDRLKTNGIISIESDTALTLAHTALINASVNLDIFHATPITDTPATLATLRAQAKAAEENLQSARTNLIKSLATLKITLQTQ